MDNSIKAIVHLMVTNSLLKMDAPYSPPKM